MKIIELHKIIKENNENLKNLCENHIKNMKIYKFHERIKHNDENLKIPFENQTNNENFEIPFENYTKTFKSCLFFN